MMGGRAGRGLRVCSASTLDEYGEYWVGGFLTGEDVCLLGSDLMRRR